MARRGFWAGVFNLLSFIAICFIGLALLIAAILQRSYGGLWHASSFEGALFMIANVIAYSTIAFYAFFFATSQRGNARIGCIIAWSLSIAMIVISYILNWV